ncbi:acetyltransferase [Vibrio anguillarum]|nr:acetyltransferase [Vibrio anguillarum]
MFTVCFLSSAMRCQPLSRALCKLSQMGENVIGKSINPYFAKQY